MIEQAIEMSASFLQQFIWVWFLRCYFGSKRSRFIDHLSFLLTVTAGFLTISFINAIAIYDGFMSGVIIVIYSVYAGFFLKGKLIEHIFINTYAIAFIFAISSVLIFIASYLSGINTEGMIANLSLWRMIMICVCRVFEFLAFKFILKINAEFRLSKKEWILFSIVPFGTWICVVFMTNATIKAPGVLSEMFYIALIMVLLNVVIFFFLYKMKQDAKMKLEYEMLTMQQDNVRSMEANMKALFESTYSVKHDMEKHLLAINAMLDNHTDAKNYIQNVVEGLNDYQKVIFTDNDVFNAIVNTKLALCKKHKIFPKVNVSNNALSFIKQTEIAVLFGNLLDNAIEAAEKSEEKIIILNVQLKREYVSIYIENSFNKDFSSVNLKTTKTEKTHHGIGVKNIKKIVEDNDGMIDYFVNEEGMFCCDILMKKAENCKT